MPLPFNEVLLKSGKSSGSGDGIQIWTLLMTTKWKNCKLHRRYQARNVLETGKIWKSSLLGTYVIFLFAGVTTRQLTVIWLYYQQTHKRWSSVLMVHFQPVFPCEEDMRKYNLGQLMLYGMKILLSKSSFDAWKNFLPQEVGAGITRTIVSNNIKKQALCSL